MHAYQAIIVCRDGAPIHIDYANQFSGAAAPKGEGSRGGKRKRGKAGAAGERGGAAEQQGHWSTEYGRDGPKHVRTCSLRMSMLYKHEPCRHLHAGKGDA